MAREYFVSSLGASEPGSENGSRVGRRRGDRARLRAPRARIPIRLLTTARRTIPARPAGYQSVGTVAPAYNVLVGDEHFGAVEWR